MAKEDLSKLGFDESLEELARLRSKQAADKVAQRNATGYVAGVSWVIVATNPWPTAP